MTTSAMTFSVHIKAVLTLGLPLVGGHLAQMAIGVTDTLMIGWYGVPELAALTIAGSFFFTLFLLGSGFAWALMPMIAQFAARSDEVQIRRATRMGLWLSILYFFAVMPLMWWSEPILLAMGQTPETAATAQTYLRIAGWGMLPGLGVMALKNYLAALEHTAIVLGLTVAGAVANGFANYALIFGNWGAPELGIEGAAIASLISGAVMLTCVLVYALRVLPEHALLQRFYRPDWEMFARVFALGLPIGLTTLAEVALFAGSAVLIGWLGEVPLAAHGIALQIASLTFMLQLGLSNAATVRAGNAMGRGDVGHLRMGAFAALLLGAIGVALSIALFLLIPEPLIAAFIGADDPAREAVIKIGVLLLAMAALFQLVDAAQVIHLGLLRGLQDTKVPMIVAVVSYWGVGMPSAYVFGFVIGWGAAGVWLGLCVGLLMASVGLAWRFWRQGAALLKYAAMPAAA